jgi:hypothetical protein
VSSNDCVAPRRRALVCVSHQLRLTRSFRGMLLKGTDMNARPVRGTMVLLSCVAVWTSAVAKEPPAELLKRLAEHDARLDQIDDQGSFTTDTINEELDRSGNAVHTVELLVRTTHLEGKKRELLGKALKDGKDVTQEYKDKLKGSGPAQAKEMRLPFSTKQQRDYLFKEIGSDPSNPSLLRIHFEPKGSWTDKLMVGDAVVDATSGELLRITARQSAPDSNVDYLDIDFWFDHQTQLGRAPSKVAMKGEGGFLFLKSRFRHTVVYSGYDLSGIGVQEAGKGATR